MKNLNLNLLDKIQFPEEGINSKVICKDENMSYTLMCLAEGTEIDTHTSVRKGSVYVIEGEGEFILEEETIKLEPGVFIHMRANAPHSLSASSSLVFLLTLVKEEGKEK